MRRFTAPMLAGLLTGAVVLVAAGLVPLASRGAPGVAGAAAPVTLTAPPSAAYLVASADGGVFSFGGATFAGSMGGRSLQAPVVGLAVDQGGGGYRLAAADGGIFAFGSATYLGSMGGRPLNQPVVGMAGTPEDQGYWLVAADGGVFTFGSSAFYGSTGALSLNAPVVAMAATPDGGGYWLVGADGGVFAFGDAPFLGSMGGKALQGRVVGITPTADGEGYWLVAADGGVFAFGDAAYLGSMGGRTLNAPVVAMATTPGGQGYWLLGRDGGTFTFGRAGFSGAALVPLGASPAVAITNGGWASQPATVVHSFGNAPGDGWQPWGSPTLVGGQLWGRTTYGGPNAQGAVIWAMTPGDPSSYRVVRAFGGTATYADGSTGPDVANPHHDLLRLGPDGKTLYGAAVWGGAHNEGGLYAEDTTTGTYTVLHAFNGLVDSADLGANPSGATDDGAQPHSNPMPVPGPGGQTVLAGMTAKGGDKGKGTLYEMGLDGSGFQVLHSFDKSSGDDPHGFVIESGSILYGMTRAGGLSAPTSNFPTAGAADPYKDGNGVVFSYDLSSGTYKVLHAFAYDGPSGTTPDGAVPDHGGLTLFDGRLYGLTTYGGAKGDGVLFSMNPDGSDYQIEHTFGTPGGHGDLAAPKGSLIPGPEGTFFALAARGGPADQGGVFEYVPGTGTGSYRVLSSFPGGSGGASGEDDPVVVPSSDGGVVLYGMTQMGGIDSTFTPTPVAPDWDPSEPAQANGVIWSLVVPS